MSVRKLFDAGYHKLVCVVPPDARLAATTTLKPAAKGKVPGIRRVDGQWVGYPFLAADPPTERDIMKWDEWGANIGLTGDHFPGLDIDCDDFHLAAALEKLALDRLGPAPVRTGRAPRQLLVYRTDEPFSRIAADIRYRGETHTVEVLGTGRQYLVHGRHPTGVDYQWAGKPLWEYEPDSLTTITAEDVQDFFQYVQDRLGDRAEVTMTGDGRVREITPAQDSLLAPNILMLREVVEAIPNDYEHRDDYIQMGYAIKAAAGGSDEGLDVFMEWCGRWEHGDNDPDTVDADWRRMHPPFAVGWNWLCEQAEAAGLMSAQVEFEADPNAVPPPTGLDLVGSVIEFTDTWVVEKLVKAVRGVIRYVPEAAHWHVWNGYAWERDRTNLAEHKIRKGLVALSHQIQERAGSHPDEKEAEKLYKFAHALQNRHALTKAVPELQAHPAVTLTMDRFDSDPWLLNTPGGVVDLKTGKMAPPDPALLMSKATATSPAPGEPEKWLAFLEEATGGDQELQKFLQRLVGYSLTGVTQEQCLDFIHGPPLTGKSVFVEAIGGMLGSYHTTAPAETFAATKGDRHPTDLAKMAGARLVTAVETQEGRSWDTQRVKSLTGGDQVSARFMRQDFFDFRPTFKIIIVGNHEPEIKGVDAAMMRRLHVIPFEHSPAEVDRLLGEKLTAEWPQVLNWAVQGCIMWLQEGLAPPEAVVARTERYRQEEDPVGEFLDQQCEFGGDDHEVTRQDLYRAWVEWCNRQGEDPGSLKQMKRRFSTKEKEYGFYNARLGGGYERPRGYRGIRLIERDELLQ